MRAYVFPDARLEKLAGRVVWLDIDSEKPENRAFVERFPVRAWPTLLAIDPANEQVLLRWMGTADAREIAKLAQELAHAPVGLRLQQRQLALVAAERRGDVCRLRPPRRRPRRRRRGRGARPTASRIAWTA